MENFTTNVKKNKEVKVCQKMTSQPWGRREYQNRRHVVGGVSKMIQNSVMFL
jgi:hypothetical protein